MGKTRVGREGFLRGPASPLQSQSIYNSSFTSQKRGTDYRTEEDFYKDW